MENSNPIFSELLNRFDNFYNTTFSLAKLKLVRSASNILTRLVAHVATIIMIMLFVVFASIAAAMWLGEYFGKQYYGFLAVSGFYLFCAIIFRLFLYAWVKKPISTIIIKEALQ